VRGYTAFSETAEPEEVIEFLGEYHAALGPLITRFEGTLSHFLGDGLMVFFNDPVPCPDPAERAVKMAVAMRDAAGGLVAAWRRRGHQLGFGAGVAQGYATLGQIGFADRSDYTAIGTVCNLAARLCGEAADGQILLARRVAVAVEDGFTLEELGSLTLKGLTQPIVACRWDRGVGGDGFGLNSVSAEPVDCTTDIAAGLAIPDYDSLFKEIRLALIVANLPNATRLLLRPKNRVDPRSGIGLGTRHQVAIDAQRNGRIGMA
jgi:class 3 adenylate cyclase